MTSQPIVHGLQVQYESQMAFLSVDVSTAEGSQAFRASRLGGHPSFLILKPDGTEVWRAVGQQDEGALRTAIERSLAAK